MEQADDNTVELIPGIADRWRDLVADLENLTARGASVDEIQEARERLRGILGDINLVPENGVLMAEVGLNEQGLLNNKQPSYISLVAGVGFEPTTFGL